MVKKITVIAISGSQGLLRRRYIQQARTKQANKGFRVETVDGARTMELRKALSQGNLMFAGSVKVLVVVRNADKANLDIIKEHHQTGDPNIILMLDYEGDPRANSKWATFFKTLGKAYKKFPKAKKAWDAEKEAIKFCEAEAKRHNKILDRSLSQALVDRTGTDFGTLAAEVDKMVTLADLDGEIKISPEVVMRAMSSLVTTPAQPVVQALSLKNKKSLSRVLRRIRITSRADPTIGICRFIGVAALKWLAVRDLVDKGLSAQEAASTLNAHPWYYKKKLAPQVRHWSREDLVRLVHILAESERAVLSGKIDPWLILTNRLLRLCG